jgi:hypothetical protein
MAVRLIHFASATCSESTLGLLQPVHPAAPTAMSVLMQCVVRSEFPAARKIGLIFPARARYDPPLALFWNHAEHSYNLETASVDTASSCMQSGRFLLRTTRSVTAGVRSDAILQLALTSFHRFSSTHS